MNRGIGVIFGLNRETRNLKGETCKLQVSLLMIKPTCFIFPSYDSVWGTTNYNSPAQFRSIITNIQWCQINQFVHLKSFQNPISNLMFFAQSRSFFLELILVHFGSKIIRPIQHIIFWNQCRIISLQESVKKCFAICLARSK